MTSLQQSIVSRLRDFQVDTPDPRWSSHVLNEFVSQVVSDGGNVGDIFQAVYSLQDLTQFSPEMANFNKELATCAFTGFQESYQSSDLKWMQDAIAKGCTPAQAYLALYTMPPELLNADCIVSILKALDGTPFWSEAVANLEDETDDTQVRKLLNDWLTSELQPQCRPDVERMAK